MNAEEFIRRHATKVVGGAVGSTVIDMTPLATEQAHEIARRVGVLEPVVSFDIAVRQQPGEQFGFDVTYYSTNGRSLTLHESVQETPAGWKIAGMNRVRGQPRQESKPSRSRP